MTTENKRHILVTDAPYCAKGDGETNDRAAIQRAIDDCFAIGGGTVELTAGRTFLSAGIVLRSGVTLLFGDNATLLQSADQADYVKPVGDGYEPYTPHCGHNFSESVKWSHYWYWNYPLIFAPEGAHDFAVRGRGTVKMMEVKDPKDLFKLCPIGFYRCSHFEICDVHITNYHSYALMPFTCDHGLFKNLKITNSNHGNGDGICLMNCRDIRVTGCEMDTGDDSVYIFSSCRDPRRSEWWNSDDPQPSVNIEVDHNRLRSNHCKAFGMILWGLNCEDQEKVEVRNVYVHDNYFATMGNWLYNPYTDKAGDPPVTNVRFENNVIDGIEINFFETQISDMNHFRSMTQLHNGGFEHGRCFWSMRGEEGVSAGVCRTPGDGETDAYGYVQNAERCDAALYQGLYLQGGRPYLFRAETKSDGEPFRLFVRDLDTGELIAAQSFTNTDWAETLLRFEVPKDGNYHIGLERGDAKKGGAKLRHASFGGHPAASGFSDVVFDRGKMIFMYE